MTESLFGFIIIAHIVLCMITTTTIYICNGGVIVIRIATEKDIPAILEIYGPYVLTTTHTFEYTVPTLAEFTERFKTITAQFPWLVWEEEGTVFGYAYASAPFKRAAYQWCCEVSVYLAPRIQGRGIGRKLYRTLEHILALQGYQVIYSVVTTENRVSLAFHQRVGYREVARLPECGVKFGRRLGVVWLEKRPDFVEIPIKPPVSWKAIVANDENLSHILDNLCLS